MKFTTNFLHIDINRGFKRLFLLYVLFCLFIFSFLLFINPTKIMDMIFDSCVRNGSPANVCVDRVNNLRNEIINNEIIEQSVNFLFFALLFPAALFIIIISARWVFRGFIASAGPKHPSKLSRSGSEETQRIEPKF
jgi:hypothetical protein